MITGINSSSMLKRYSATLYFPSGNCAAGEKAKCHINIYEERLAAEQGYPYCYNGHKALDSLGLK